MRSALRLLAFAAALIASQVVLAQSIRLVPTANYGTTVALGGTTPRVSFTVFDQFNQVRPGAIVHFDDRCTYLQRGETPPYGCVTLAPGEVVDVAADGAGVVRSPIYQANGTAGIAWLNAILVLDGQVLTVPFFFRVGTTATPMQIYSGNNQQVLVSGPLNEPLAVRVIDDRGRWMVGVPVQLTSSACTSVPGTADNLPCVRLDSTAGLTDPNGIFRVSGTTNAIPGNYIVQGGFGGSVDLNFNLTNYLPRRLAVEPLKQLGLRIVDAPASCSIDFFEREPVAPPAKPTMLATPYGVVRVKINGCPAGATLKMQFLHPGGFPEGEKVWSAAPTWQAFTTVNPVEGTSEFTFVEGSAADIDTTSRIETVLAIAFGDPASPNFQDLWWSGASGNGWGMSIVQHGQVLFPILFVYDAAGEPTWFVMPAGSWNAAHDEYSGSLYSPRGKPLGTHRATDLVAGPAAGRAVIRLRDSMTLDLDLLLPGVDLRLPLVRQKFGYLVPNPMQRVEDLWWPGADRSGWGLVLQQQYSSVFGLLFTYRTDGKATWAVMPNTYWSDASTLEGNVFTTKSSSWPDYDASRLTSQQLGTVLMKFGTGTLTMDFVVSGRTDRVVLTPQPF